VTQSHYYASSGQSFATASEEITMYTFMPTKEEEEEEEEEGRNNNNINANIRIRRI